MSVSAYDRVRAAREKNRPTGLDYIHNLFGTFLECHGDRCYADDRPSWGASPPSRASR